MHLLQPGLHLAGYEILAFVAKGGMGEVYRARQVAMDRVVALKILSPHLAKRDPVFVHRFVAEARAAGRLNHANIVRVHDVDRAVIDSAQGPLEVDCFAMEFVEGETVKDVIARYGICPVRLVVKVMQGMAEALVYAQQQGLVHRDIKPENVMLSRDGEVKLADLGLALQTGADDSVDVTGTARGKVVGTPAYMSPEQACAQPVDHRSDQYSLGATLYHMLTGQPPYGAGDSRAVMRAHVFDPVPDPQALGPELPEGWCRLCRRMLAKQPEDRFADAEELRAAVAVLVEGGRVDASGSPVLPRRIPWRMVGAAAGILVVLGMSAWLAPQLMRRAAASPAPAAEDRIAAALAALPPDDAAARLALIDRLMADPANAEATGLLARVRGDCLATLAQNEAARRARLQEEAHQRRSEERLAAIRSDLAAGHLAAARRGLTELGEIPVGLESQRKDAQAACERLQTERREELGARIDRADETAMPALEGAIAGSELVETERAALVARLAARRETLQRQAQARQAESETAAWRAIAQAWEARRGEAFDPLAIASPWSPQIVRTERRLAWELLAGATAVVPRIEAALTRWIAANRPETDVIAEGRWRHVRLVRWDAAQVQMQDTAAGEGELRTVARRQLSLVLAPLVARALAQARTDGLTVGDSPRALAVHLWCCRAADAPLVLATQNDDAALALLTGSEALLARKPLALACGASLTADGTLVPGAAIAYGGGQAWIGLGGDFAGPPLQAVADAWGLTITAAVPRPVEEAKLPTWAWRGRLRGPAVLDAQLRLAPETPSVLVGFRTASGHALRLGVRPCDRSQGWVRTTTDRPAALGTAPWTPRSDRIVTLHLALEADGSATASVDGVPVQPLTQSGVAADPVTPVLQVVTDDKHPAAKVEVLSFRVETVR